jgi:hypothetical protein
MTCQTAAASSSSATTSAPWADAVWVVGLVEEGQHVAAVVFIVEVRADVQAIHPSRHQHYPAVGGGTRRAVLG